MSGGSMEYAYQRIHDVQELLLTSISKGGNHRELPIRVAHHLSQCAAVLKAMEWADSCDTGPDEWVPAAEHLLDNPPDQVIAAATGRQPKARGNNPEADGPLIKRYIAALRREAEELEASLRERITDTDGAGLERVPYPSVERSKPTHPPPEGPAPMSRRPRPRDASKILLIALMTATGADGQSRAETGAPGTGEVTITAGVLTADSFHRQGFSVDGPLERRTTIAVDTTVNASSKLAIHIGTGWGAFYAAAGGSPTGLRDSHHGRQDTTLGLTWRMDGRTPGREPTGAVKIRGRLPGPYDAGYTNSLGDGATEVQGSVAVENLESRIGWITEIGYRRRTHAFVNPAGINEPTTHHVKVDVPNETFAFVGTYGQINDRVRIGLEYSAVNAHDGLDIGVDDWSPDRWPGLHEDMHHLGVTLRIKAGRIGVLEAGAGKVVSGRNTPAYSAYTLSWTRRITP